MPDFAMCDDDSCPYKAECRRHPDSGTVPDKYQYWSMFVKPGPPVKPENCEGWVPRSE